MPKLGIIAVAIPALIVSSCLDQVGGEGQPCNKQGLCQPGLVCDRDNICVKPSNVDTDNDGVPDNLDVCPSHYNESQDLNEDPKNCGSCGTDCNDRVGCTVDTCVGGYCFNTPDNTACNDQKECTIDTCDASDGCQNTPAETGTTCGDLSDTECDNPDLCDGLGNCLPNYEPVGTDCGDPSGTECTLPDKCDGNGRCLSNHMSAGTSCGDHGVVCHKDDTCDGAGICLDRGYETEGTPCPDNLFCNGVEKCDNTGNCLPGPGNPCTPSTVCNESQDTCVGCNSHTDCPICMKCNFGTNECENQLEGEDLKSECESVECYTGSCDGVGACGLDPEEKACGDTADLECDNPDTCDGQGNCLNNYETFGTPCHEEHGTCDNGTCVCLTGYAGENCDSCAPGYIGYPDCVDDPCDPDPCNGHGTCNDGNCTCDTGYDGSTCNQCYSGYIGYPDCVDDPCEPDPCNGNGTCVDGDCTCSTGYAGLSCDQCDPAYSAYPDCNECVVGAFGEYPFCFLPSAEYCETNQCFIVPPTNQSLCYNNSSETTCTAFPCNADGSPDFCGQDAHYIDNVRIYTCYDASGVVQDPCDASADEGEVVTDSLTGLMWQRTFATGRTWQQAVDYCNSLNIMVYGGYDDWRLPNPFELQSMVDDGKSNPWIDTAVFPGTQSSWFWSSVSNVFDPANEAWTVNFGHDYRYYGVGTLNKNSNGIDVRCVRLSHGFPTSGGYRFTVWEPIVGEEVVYDAVTNLLWQKNPETNKAWQEALSFCESSSYGGFTDWRLPDKKELMSIINYSRRNPASDFPDIPWENDTFLSSSSNILYMSENWIVRFYYGAVYCQDKVYHYSVICVRNGL